MSLAVEAKGLTKSYKDVKALIGVDLEVPTGTILGLLGPNGAGKTTTVRILSTLLQPDAGSALVAGIDILKNPAQAREIIGLSGQYAAVDENLTGRENLIMVGRLFRLPKNTAIKKCDELLEKFNLVDARDRVVKTYSGGMRRRLDLASALIGNPTVLFLDEPTTGLDPRSRLLMWGIIRDLVRDGTTVLLTTQYLEEADQLADKIMVIDHGRVIAEGTANELKRKVGGERIEVRVPLDRVLETQNLLRAIGSGEVSTDVDHLTVPVVGKGGTKVVEVVRALDAAGIEIEEIQLRQPTLDEVFLTLTGHAAEEVTV
ncbi:MAG: ATP-binding cassette domain-containing protein [Candidatus Nanopelagicales bacterium]